MTLESLATFLTEHPNWAPVLRENAEIVGVASPSGGFVPLAILDKLLAVPSHLRRRLFPEG